MKKLILLLIAPLLFFMSVVSADVTVPERPSNGVYDPLGYLNSVVADTVADMNSSSETQVGIYIVDTLEGEHIESVANKVARSWKIGKSDTNSGILIAIAIKDRKFRIETSNEASTWLTDSRARELLDEAKYYMREQNYSEGVSSILTGISNLESKKADIVKENEERQAKLDEAKESMSRNSKRFFFYILPSFLGLVGIGSLIDWYSRLRRSRFDYDGYKKLYPDSYGFVFNKSWGGGKVTEYYHEKLLKRSQYDYDGYDKLYPDSADFVPNETWSSYSINAYYKKKEMEEKDKLRRSKYNYKGKDKLYPSNRDFVENDSWTDALLVAYFAEHSNSSSHSSSYDSGSSSSDSSWSSSDWGGGGFDGGGASGGW